MQNMKTTATTYKYEIYVKYTFMAYTIMLIFGIPGHILSILTITQTSLSKTSRTFLCVALSVVDSCFLITQYIRMAGHHIHNNDFVNVSHIVCKLGDFSFLYFTHMDAFIIVVISTERLLAIYKPHLVRKLVTPAKTKIIISILAIFFLILDGEFIIR